MRAAVYTRVSSEMQLEGYSLEAQLTACRRRATEREPAVVVQRDLVVVDPVLYQDIANLSTWPSPARRLARTSRDGRSTARPALTVRRNQAVSSSSPDEQGHTPARLGTVDGGLAAPVRVPALLHEAS